MIGELDHLWTVLRHSYLRDQKGLWINSFFRQLAYAMMGVFAAVFVFELGQENFLGGGIKAGLLLLLVFLIVIRLVTLVVAVPMAEYVIKRIGYRKTIFLSLAFSSGAFLSLSMADTFESWEMVMVSGVFFGLTITTYWVTYWTLLDDATEVEHMGKAWGLMQVFSKLGQVAAPIVGALIATTFGFSSLFAVGILFLALSAVPIWFLGSHKHLDKVSLGEFFEWTRERSFLKAGVAMGGEGVVTQIYENLWPIYVFLVVGGLRELGVFKSLVILATVVFTYVVSVVFDKKPKKAFQVVGVLGGVVAWGLRGLVSSFGQLLAVDTTDRFFDSMSTTFFSGYLLKRAKGSEAFSFMVYREMWRGAFMAVASAFLLLMVVMLELSYFWSVAFALAALMSVLSLLISDKRK